MFQRRWLTGLGGAWADEASDEDTAVMMTLYFMHDPPRLEFHMDVQGARDASEAMADGLYKYGEAIYEQYAAAKAAKVQVRRGRASIKHTGSTSNVSDTMDEHTNYDRLFASMADVLR